MTPAEELAKAKKPRKRRQAAGPPRPATWVCRLVEARESLRLSQREVAAACGLSPPGYWLIESGNDPHLTTARRLAEFFGKTIPDLWPSLAQPKETT